MKLETKISNVVDMTHIEKRSAIFSSYGYHSVVEFCQMWHEALTGSTDPLTQQDVHIAIEFLETCLNTWIPSRKKCKGYDAAVKSLIKAVLVELKSC